MLPLGGSECHTDLKKKKSLFFHRYLHSLAGLASNRNITVINSTLVGSTKDDLVTGKVLSG